MRTLYVFKELGGYDKKDPLERLKFFCSLGLCSEDWLEVESFFIDAQQGMYSLKQQLAEAVPKSEIEKLIWRSDSFRRYSYSRSDLEQLLAKDKEQIE